MPVDPVLLHPKAMGSDIFRDSMLWHLFTYCLLSAANKDVTVAIDSGSGEKKIKLKRGEMAFSRKLASDATGIPQSTIRNKILKLIDAKTVSITIYQGYSVLTIIKYEQYQKRSLSIRQPVQSVIFDGSDTDLYIGIVKLYNRVRGILPACLEEFNNALFKKMADRKKELKLNWEGFKLFLKDLVDGCQEVDYYTRTWQPSLRWMMHSKNNLDKVREKVAHAQETNTFQGR